MNQSELDAVLRRLRRFPDVEADNLFAHDATDRLLLDTAEPYLSGPGTKIAVIGDRYGALTLGVMAGLGVHDVRVHQDLYTSRLALRNNAAMAGSIGNFSEHELDRELLDGVEVVLLQLPKSLAELEQISETIAQYASPNVVVLAGGRVKHMTVGMNAILGRTFGQVQPQLARQKSRIVIATQPMGVEIPRYPVTETNEELGIVVCAHGAVFAGPSLDIGTRFLLSFFDRIPAAKRAVDLGCGTGILATMYAVQHPDAQVKATDQSAAAVASARGTAEANGLSARIDVVQDDAMSCFPDSSADLILLNPPFHLGSTVHSGAALKLFDAASRVLAPGGELWTVWNNHLQYRPVLERLVGPTSQQGRNAKFTVTRTIKP
ncbi:class I SAM-dependent methyltransferase [Arthrobacter sp. M4]|uniref:class I SAM-dependent methyltransferase n=1 Tax=Arthrobacter sp. M4 TaxID=218160 RepID=UPI001CDBD103|nr:class I SAM-dependent methyltransferase [Arthrobacter sp. M4]MCA4131282.1 methyltransferase [Arthrobacter sp. M4]